MSGVGGGLHDRDPEPDRHQIVPQPKIKASQREWLFWGAMLVGLWAVLQTNRLLVFLMIILTVIFSAVRFLYVQVITQIRESKEKGFWR